MLVEMNEVTTLSAFLEYLQGGDPSDEIAGLCWYLTAQVLLQLWFGAYWFVYEWLEETPDLWALSSWQRHFHPPRE